MSIGTTIAHDLGTTVVHEPTGSAIQTAIDSLPDGGGTVVLPPGTYEITRTVRIPDGVCLQGSGTRETLLSLAPGSNCHLLTNAEHARGNTDISVRSVTLIGNRLSQRRDPAEAAASFCCGAYFRRVGGLEISDCRAEDIFQSGLHVSGCAHVRVARFLAHTIGWSGIATSGTDDIVVRDARIRDSGLDGRHSAIHFDGGVGIYLGADIEGCTGNGVMLESSFAPLRMAAIDCVVRQALRGVAVSGHHDKETTDVLISGDYSQNRESGVMVANASHVVIHRCVIEHNEDYGVLMQGRSGARRCLFVDCRIGGNGQDVREKDASDENYYVDGSWHYQEPLNRNGANGREKRLGSDVAVVLERSQMNGNRHFDRAAVTKRVEDAFRDRCAICGEDVEFRRYQGEAVRESYPCPSCRATLRDQGQARMLLQMYSATRARSVKDLVHEDRFRSLSIYEPGTLGPFRPLLGTLPGYVQSNYWPDLERGAMRDGIRCEDLMALTFGDDSFDIVITSDIFEHVREPDRGFAEIHRVLRPGGVHIFSVPVLDPMSAKTVRRVDTSGPDDVPLMEPRYHGGPGGGRYLVYTDFGADLLDDLSLLGLETTAGRLDFGSAQARRLLTFCSVKRNGEGGKR